MRNVGIYKVDEGAYEKESRLPMVKGGSVGLGLGGSGALAYSRQVGVHGMSPLGLFSDDYVLVGLGIIVAGTVIGVAAGRLASKVIPARGKPPKDTP